MLLSFDSPDDDEVKDFWMRACHAVGPRGSYESPQMLSGWLTAFCMWNDNGVKISRISDRALSTRSLEPFDIANKRLVLDGLPFHIIHIKDIPVGVSEMPVTLVNGSVQIKTTVIAGQVGMEGIIEGSGGDAGIIRVQPRSGWWMIKDDR